MADGLVTQHGARIATDEIGGYHYIRSKLTFGADNSSADVSAADPLPVYVISGGGSGGLTNTELRASAVPVSIAATVTVTGALTDTQLRATPVPVSGTVTANAGSGTFAVSGTFWQATQPVSLTTLPALVAGAALIGKVGLDQTTPGTTNAVALAQIGSTTVASGNGVVGAGVQRVAIASDNTAFAVNATLQTGANVIGALSANQSVNNAQIAGVATATGNGVVGTGVQRVAIASDNTAFSVNAVQATLTKGTQGSTGVSTQDLKDAGRAIVNAATAIAGVTAVTTEALLTLAVSRDCAATSNVTTIAVTSNKRLRVTHVVVGLISTGASVLSGRFSLRMNPSGAAAANSPIIATLPVPSGAALAQAGGCVCMTVPDGIEFSGTQQIGISQLCSATTGTVWASIVGYEY